MGRRLIGILILLATISVAGIIATQIYWLDKAFEVQQSQIHLREEQATAESKQFNDRVTIALTNVADELLSLNNDPAELFQSVKQIRPNYFTVAINDTVHPFLLQRLLTSEFERRNINENFEYGVYDCFTDSIVYGDYVALNDDSDTTSTYHVRVSPKIKWDKDGHYFGVFFPDRTKYEINAPKPKVSTWAFSAIISLIVFVFFAYAVYLILRQKRLSEMKTDFINNMTHELKTPISTISLSSEILLGQNIVNQPDRLKKYAQLIFNENQRLRMQVDKVLQLASLDKKHVQLNYKELDIQAYILNAVEALRLVSSDESLKIELDLKAENSFINGDPVHIANVIHNLLDNAVKYSGDRARIRIETSNRNGDICLVISDNGIGIPKKSMPYIFDQFYRVPTGNLHDVKGFGLGLFYVKQIIVAHKAKISVESAEGKGTRFSLIFPLAKHSKN